MAHKHSWKEILTTPTKTGSDEWVLKSEADEALNQIHSSHEALKIVTTGISLLLFVMSMTTIFKAQ